ncbi:hypothetical protein D3C71_1559390 [compost metagenome]
MGSVTDRCQGAQGEVLVELLPIPGRVVGQQDRVRGGIHARTITPGRVLVSAKLTFKRRRTRSRVRSGAWPAAWLLRMAICPQHGISLDNPAIGGAVALDLLRFALVLGGAAPIF